MTTKIKTPLPEKISVVGRSENNAIIDIALTFNQLIDVVAELREGLERIDNSLEALTDQVNDYQD